jgi:LysR family glycine cleavage system transcriptional activator
LKRLQQLNLNALRVVESAARHGNFTRAGEENLVTASAVSQRIKALEDQLEFRIFHRRANSVVLTSEGEEFISRVREALDQILAAGMEIKDRKKSSVLKISVLPTFATRWLLPKLTSFQHTYPDLNLCISQSYKPVNFNREDVDLAVRYGRGGFANLHCRLLFEEDLIPVCSPDLLAQARQVLGTGELEPSHLRHFTLLHSETCTMNWQSWLQFAGAPEILDQAKSMTFDTCMLSFDAANAGLGFAVANRAYVADDLKKGRLVAPFKMAVQSGAGWHLVYPEKYAAKPKVQAFENWIAREIERQVQEGPQEPAGTHIQ